MNLVLLADDAFSFLFAGSSCRWCHGRWCMAHHREAATRRAGFVYLVMASFGTMALLLAFGLLAGAERRLCLRGDPRHRPHPPAMAAVVLVLMLVGAGSKAGLVPLHVWLPLAHPAAPSHVSALMSGVMTKVAVYGFIRIVFDLLGAAALVVGPWSAGLGGATAVLGRAATR